MRRRHNTLPVLVAAAGALMAVGCVSGPEPAESEVRASVANDAQFGPGDDAADPPMLSIVMSSDLDRRAVQPVVDAFSAKSGVEVDVRYEVSMTPDSAATADVLVTRRTDRLDRLRRAGALAELPAALVERSLPRSPRLTHAERHWIPVTGEGAERVVVAVAARAEGKSAALAAVEYLLSDDGRQLVADVSAVGPGPSPSR